MVFPKTFVNPLVHHVTGYYIMLSSCYLNIVLSWKTFVTTNLPLVCWCWRTRCVNCVRNNLRLGAVVGMCRLAWRVAARDHRKAGEKNFCVNNGFRYRLNKCRCLVRCFLLVIQISHTYNDPIKCICKLSNSEIIIPPINVTACKTSVGKHHNVRCRWPCPSVCITVQMAYHIGVIISKDIPSVSISISFKSPLINKLPLMST